MQDSSVVLISTSRDGFVSLEFLHTTYSVYFYLNRWKVHSWVQR